MPATPLTAFSALGLTAIGALHLIWATGSPWPASDRERLADLAAGRLDRSVPPPAACVAVAAACTTAAGFVAGRPRRHQRLRRLGATGVAGVLGVRGILGLAGRTDLVSPGSVSPVFRRRDRRFYSPLCLALAAGAVMSLRTASGSQPC